jgi:hypothetical protein
MAFYDDTIVANDAILAVMNARTRASCRVIWESLPFSISSFPEFALRCFDVITEIL